MKKPGVFSLICLLGICVLLCAQGSAAVSQSPAGATPDAWNVEFVGSFPIAAPYNAMDVDVYGGYAYLAAGGLGLRVIDVSNPASPSEDGDVWTQNGNGVVVAWPYAHVGGGDLFFVVDISDPAAPSTEGSVNPYWQLGRLALDGLHAYVVEGTGGLGVVDVSDPANPDHVALRDTPGNALDVAISGNHAYVADSASGLQVIDITTPTNPVVVGDGYAWTDKSATGVAARGGYAYVVLQNNGGLRVVDVSVPGTPDEVGFVELPNHASGVEVEGDYAYVALNQSGLYVINISDPTNPWVVGSYDTGFAYSVDLDGGLVYLADQTDGMVILRFLGFSGYTISGQVLDSNETPLPGVTISAGGGLSAVTNESGTYAITGLPPGDYTLTPSLAEWTFDPATVQVTVPPDAADQHFVGSPICPDSLDSLTISGPTEGISDTLYAFTGVVSPADATEPITYTWSPEPSSGQSTSSAVYSWTVPAVYSLSLGAENCGGVAGATHTILIGSGAAKEVGPDQGGTLVYTDTQGSPTVIQVPAGAVTGTVTLVYSPTVGTIPPPGLGSAGHAFTLDAYRDGLLLPGLQFEPPFTVTITYTDTEMVGLDEETLGLRFWDGAVWSPEGISVTGRLTLSNQLEATSEHLSTFALFGQEQWRVYLPVNLRSR